VKLVEQLLGEKPRAVVRSAGTIVAFMAVIREEPHKDVANVRQQDGLDIGLNIFLGVDLAKRSRRRPGAFRPSAARYVGDGE
jgi:hypothetical protein